ncbi:hypothetical protein HD554DRAFT_2040072 [Boletus coccyginus]|nr:hypothetical protein HD554DRAFT_2040072 [Boletus coccyginus]
MPIFPGLHHIKKGVSTIKQWTVRDYKQFEWVFIGTLIGTDVELCVQQAACSLMDFVHLAEYCSHTNDTLTVLQNALDDFHHLKDVLDGLNTKISEHLHIDFAKKVYATTNQKDYTIQMTQWLQQQEVVVWFSSYQTW